MTESLRLFLVEDEDDIALLMRKSLERAGHRVAVCHSGADALIVLSHGEYDLVLLDQILPDMRGVDLLERVAAEGITTPVLMVTRHGSAELVAQVLRAGALDYISKDPALTFLTELPKRATEAVTRHRLQQFNRLLIAALESARDGILITDLQGTILHVNQALEHLTGYARQELLGQTPRLLKSGSHPPETYARLWQTILGRSSWQGELVNRRKDGTLFDTSLTVSPIMDGHGALTHFVGIYRDISDRKILERQLLQAQKMQSVGTLAGGVAHEFNNLLAGIQGYAALGLRECGWTPATREFLQYIVELADRAANLTRQLLAFARKPALSRQPTRMDALLETTVELMRRSLRIEAAVDIQEQASDGEPLAALADANQLQQVLINLALNARDAATEPATVTFRLRQAILEGEMPAFPESVPAGDYAVLEVEDRGRGMSTEVLGQALDPFFTTKEVGQGTGLGLPVAFGIVHGHQGFLTIDSEIGRGTKVRLFLPRLAGGTRDRLASAEPDREQESKRTTQRTILVVDDEEAVLDVLQRFLEIAGHRVYCAASGREALALLDEERPEVELVVLDLMIPREDGATTVVALRERRPGLPVLVCTGLMHADPAPALLRQPSVSLLRKPFKMNELWKAVQQALGKESRSDTAFP